MSCVTQHVQGTCGYLTTAISHVYKQYFVLSATEMNRKNSQKDKKEHQQEKRELPVEEDEGSGWEEGKIRKAVEQRIMTVTFNTIMTVTFNRMVR
jgi:hypothetical protein